MMDDEQTPKLPQKQVLLGRYEVMKVLGRGSMGEVLEVRDLHTNTNFALKHVPPEVARRSSQMATIRGNFTLVSRLTHPHIAVTRFLEMDAETSDVLVIMDLVPGCDMATWLQREREKLGDPEASLPWPVVLGVAEQIASALDYAHSQPVGFATDGSVKRHGVLHRDLKPENVMVELGREFRPGVPFVRVVDFGLAAEIQASMNSMTRQIENVNKPMGTPLYMAPEQWLGRRLTRAIDQWALAVMIYELAEGCLPFHAMTLESLQQQICNPQPETPENLTAPQWMALRRALLADRTRRYRSCAALVEALAGAEKNLRETMDLSDTLFPEEFSSEDSSLLLAMQTKAPDGGCGSSSQLHGVSSPHLPYESQTAGEEWDHNRISMKFVWCPPGEITMLFPNKGEKQESAYRAAVTLSKGFWLGKYAVTQAEWEQVMGTAPWSLHVVQGFVRKGRTYPAAYISWEDARTFCQKLTDQERFAGNLPVEWQYRLPSEAQWEFARVCGGSDFPGENPADDISPYAWHHTNTHSIGEPFAHEVGRKQANRWGLHDMQGNVYEWCFDWYQDRPTGGMNPAVTTPAAGRVFRGGCWLDSSSDCRLAARGWSAPGHRSYYVGFRVALQQVSRSGSPG